MKYYVWNGNKKPYNCLQISDETHEIFLNTPKDGFICSKSKGGYWIVREGYLEVPEPQYRDMTPQEVFEIMAKGAVVIDYECEDFVGTCMKYNINDNNYCTGYGYAELSRFRYSLPHDDFLNKWHEFKVEAE